MGSQYDRARVHRPDGTPSADDSARRPLRVEGKPLTVWIVSPEVCIARIHWSGSRTFGCYMVHGSGLCPGCHGRWPVQDAYYLTVSTEARADWAPDLLQLTKVAVQSCPRLLTDEASLWGRRLTVWRHPGLVTDPMYAEMDVSESPKDLPEAEPTLWTLIRCWQARTKAETLAKRALQDGKAAPNGQ